MSADEVAVWRVLSDDSLEQSFVFAKLWVVVMAGSTLYSYNRSPETLEKYSEIGRCVFCANYTVILYVLSDLSVTHYVKTQSSEVLCRRPFSIFVTNLRAFHVHHA